MRNSEGYSDPTYFAALANIMREERKQRREEERKERKQRYNNRPGAHKVPKGEKYRNATNKPISKTGGRKE